MSQTSKEDLQKNGDIANQFGMYDIKYLLG